MLQALKLLYTRFIFGNLLNFCGEELLVLRSTLAMEDHQFWLANDNLLDVIMTDGAP